MKMIPVEIRGGLLALPAELKLSPRVHLAVLVIENGDTSAELQTLADAGGAFDFLREEPDLYSDADVLPERKNPRFALHPAGHCPRQIETSPANTVIFADC